MTSVFIGNVPYQATEADLEALFLQFEFHPKSVRIIMDRDTGQSRGFGFVDLGTETERTRAKEQVDGQMLHGRPLSIRDADSKPTGTRGRDGGGGGSQRPFVGKQDAFPPEPRGDAHRGGDGHRGGKGVRRTTRRSDDW